MDAATLLLDNWADMNAVCNNGSTPLMLATQKRHLPLVNLLLTRGADPNIVDKEGQGALDCAATLGYEEIVERVVEGGGDVKRADINGETPLREWPKPISPAHPFHTLPSN